MSRLLSRAWQYALFAGISVSLVAPAATAAPKAKPKAAPKAAVKAKAPTKKKKSRLNAKAVANNELLDKKFLGPYKAGIDALNKGNPDLAIKHAQVAISRRPSSGRALLVLASAYKAKKLYNSAIQYYKDAAKKFTPKKELYEGAQALYNVAFCYEIMRQRPNAIAAWQLFVNYTNTYTMQHPRRDFALKRIKALQSVKGPTK